MTRHNTTDRDRVLDAAIRAGKIAAADRDRYARMYDANPHPTRRLLTARVEEGGLMPGLVGPGEDPATATPGGYDPQWLTPGERERVAKAAPLPSPAPAPRSQPQRAASAPASAVGEQYDASWLSPEERKHIAAAKDGRTTHGPVQFEGPEVLRAAGAGR